jgi:hypothetical protein
VASRTFTQLVSDLSGRDIPDGDGETVEFAYRGKTYAIDLTSKEAAAFDTAIANYVDNARPVGSGRSRKVAGGSDAKQIRAWAKKRGYDVPDRGRIPLSIREEYQAAL